MIVAVLVEGTDCCRFVSTNSAPSDAVKAGVEWIEANGGAAQHKRGGKGRWHAPNGLDVWSLERCNAGDYAVEENR